MVAISGPFLLRKCSGRSVTSQIPRLGSPIKFGRKIVTTALYVVARGPWAQASAISLAATCESGYLS